jgi:hypothetical protein
MKSKLTIILFGAALTLAGLNNKQTFTGVITDDMCARDHTMMRIAPEAACVIECVKGHGSKYVLHDGKKAYILSDQKTPEQFAAKQVKVTGTYYEKTNIIKVESIEAAN